MTTFPSPISTGITALHLIVRCPTTSKVPKSLDRSTNEPEREMLRPSALQYLIALALLGPAEAVPQVPGENAPAELPNDDRPGLVTQSCPQYPLLDNGDGTYLYYANYYEIDCDSEVQADYLNGLYSWPEPCDGNCVFALTEDAGKQSSHESTAVGTDAGSFMGLASRIQQNHEILPDPFDTNEYPNTIPPGPARASARRMPLPAEDLYLRFTVGGETSPRYFKCFLVNPATAVGGDADKFYVALEMKSAPGSRARPVDVWRKLRGEFAYSVDVDMSTGKANLLLLCARDAD